MPATREQTIRLHRAQAGFRCSLALYRGFVGGRGSGKSWVGAYDLIRRAKPGCLYLVGAPTYGMLADSTFRTFMDLARELGRLDPETVRLSPPSCQLAGKDGPGPEILFRSAEDPERFRGPNLSGCWLDEASLMDLAAYEIAIACLRQGGEVGWLSATFTPKGTGHWTYDVFGKDQPRPHTELFHATTADNPFLPREFAETITGQYGEGSQLALQELGGKFVSLQGTEWPSWYFDGIWFDEWPPNLGLKGLALDPSKGQASKDRIADPRKGRQADYSAFVWGGLDGEGILYVDADLDNRRDTSKIVDDGLAILRSFRPDGFIGEANSFQELLLHEFIRRGRERQVELAGPYAAVNTLPKQVRIRKLGPRLAKKEIRFKRGSKGAELVVRQLQDFPLSEKDDGPDALEMLVRLLLYLLRGRRGERQEPEIVRMD